MRELTTIEIEAVSGASNDGQRAAMYAGIAAVYGGAAAIPSPLSPALGLIAGASAAASAWYAYQAAK